MQLKTWSEGTESDSVLKNEARRELQLLHIRATCRRFNNGHYLLQILVNEHIKDEPSAVSSFHGANSQLSTT